LADIFGEVARTHAGRERRLAKRSIRR